MTIQANRIKKVTGSEGGGGFNPRIKPTESMLALATERRFSRISPEISSFFRSLFSPGGTFLGQCGFFGRSAEVSPANRRPAADDSIHRSGNIPELP
jgi:hypothetical protein